MKNKLRFRQIHLDFHTSEHLPEVGKNFDAEEFASTLSKAKVNSITCFSRCHHGWLYYESKNFPEKMHPNLVNRNILKEQIEACHKYDIKVPVYTTIQWDDLIAREHPEWQVVNEKGGPFKQEKFKPGFYRNLCLNTGYLDYLKAQIKDMFESLGNLDGVFLDILNLQPCACNSCISEMKSLGLDASDELVRYEFGQKVFDRFIEDMTKFINSIQPDCPVFYNIGHIGAKHRNVLDSFSHLEIESLPGGYWGYDHFPSTARYVRTLGMDFMGMTGKFHTDWGDFSSFRTQAALEYECFLSLAHTGKCSIGDQLGPDGKISAPVYDLIGKMYTQIEAKEPWCEAAKPIAEFGVFLPEEFLEPGAELTTSDLLGADKMLTELGIQFDVIDTKSDLTKYKILIMPDNIPVDDSFDEKLTLYINNGGKIIASYKSGLSPKGDFVDFMGISLIGEAPYSPDFIVTKGDITKGLYDNTEYVMYLKGMEVAVREGAEKLIDVNVPFFNRTWEHFTSHKHTPSSGEYGYPGVVKNDNVIYFMHPIFTQYKNNGPRWIKTMVSNAIDMFIDQRLVVHNGPSSLNINLNMQEYNNRYVLHMLHYIPEKRTESIDIIEDIIPLYNIDIKLNLDETITSVKLVPENKNIEFEINQGILSFAVPEIRGHQMIELAY